MTHHSSHRHLRAACALVLALAFVPATALAVGPALSAHTIVSEGFEGATPAGLTLDWVYLSGQPTPPAYWGPVTRLATHPAHSGSRGLWCAGSIPGSTANAWTTFGGRYRDNTAGLATFDLPDLADYYSATLDYWYQMPSIGSADGDSLNVKWSSTVGGDFWDSHVAWPVTSAWTHVTLNLSAPTPLTPPFRPVDLSRTPGKVEFQFVDDAGNFGESPTVGEGPTIDDVVVSGYKFGPVRDLAAAVNGTDVQLSWGVPARSTALFAADEERPVSYRVWRSPDAVPYAWTELTFSRAAGTTFDDVALPGGGAYRYVVQAWDPDSGTGYGEVSVPSGTARAFIATPPPAPVSTITVNPVSPNGTGGVYITTPTVGVSRNAEGTTLWRWDSGAFASTPLLSFAVPVSPGTHTLEVYSVNASDVAEAAHVTRTITVNVPPVRTKPTLSTPTLSVSTPTHGRAFTVRGSLSPKHAAATTVRIYVYRKSASGYHYYGTYHAVTVAVGSTSFSHKITLSLKGSYRMRTYHTDAAHIGTFSSYRTFKVK